VEKYDTIREATGDNIIHCMHFACWLNKATGTDLEYVVVVVVERSGWFCCGPCISLLFSVGLSTLPSFILATRLIIPFSQSLGFKNTHPKVLYLLHASAGQ